jgi:hypothetical protein
MQHALCEAQHLGRYPFYYAEYWRLPGSVLSHGAHCDNDDNDDNN